MYGTDYNPKGLKQSTKPTKPEYIINTRSITRTGVLPGRVTGVAWYRYAMVHRVRPGFDFGAPFCVVGLK